MWPTNLTHSLISLYLWAYLPLDISSKRYFDLWIFRTKVISTLKIFFVGHFDLLGHFNFTLSGFMSFRPDDFSILCHFDLCTFSLMLIRLKICRPMWLRLLNLRTYCKMSFRPMDIDDIMTFKFSFLVNWNFGIFDPKLVRFWTFRPLYFRSLNLSSLGIFILVSFGTLNLTFHPMSLSQISIC